MVIGFHPSTYHPVRFLRVGVGSDLPSVIPTISSDRDEEGFLRGGSVPLSNVSVLSGREFGPWIIDIPWPVQCIRAKKRTFYLYYSAWVNISWLWPPGNRSESLMFVLISTRCRCICLSKLTYIHITTSFRLLIFVLPSDMLNLLY